jgi:hypothetical protein
MTGLPGVQVLLDDGTGTYPYDISSRLEGTLSISSYGRTDEFATAQSAQLSLTLDNSDGAVASGVGFPGGPLTKGTGIRVKLTSGATTRNRFTGRIAGADLGWVGGSGRYSLVDITAMDLLTDLNAVELGSMLEEEIRRDHPTTWYPMSEESGSAAGDVSGSGQPPLVPVGSGAAPVFGAVSGLADGSPGVQLLGGKLLSADFPVIGTGSWTIEICFHTSSLPGAGLTAPLISVTNGGTEVVRLEINQIGTLGAVVPAGSILGSGNVADGAEHCVMVTFDGTNLRLYLDGALIQTGPVPAPGAGTKITLGNLPDPLATPLAFTPFVGVVSSLVVVDGGVLGAARAADHAGAAVTGFSGETTDARLTRLAAYAGIPTSTTTGMSGQTMGVQVTSGMTLLAALQQVADAEGGFLYADGSGTVVLQGRAYRAAKTVADLTLSSEELVDPSITVDDQQQLTFVTVNRVGGATQVAGARTPGVEDKSIDLVVDSDADALRAAQWLVAKHANPGPRLGSGAFALLNSTSAAAFLAREIGDRLAFSNMPTQVWPGFGDVTIEGWTETVSERDWSLTANLLPWSLATALVLDDPVYGALDAYPIMN